MGSISYSERLSLCSLCVVMIMEVIVLKRHPLNFLVFVTVMGAGYMVDCVSSLKYLLDT